MLLMCYNDITGGALEKRPEKRGTTETPSLILDASRLVCARIS